MAVVSCLECGGEVEVAADAIIGEIVACPDCSVEMEVTSLNPLTVVLAAEVEEDWGE